MFFGKRRWAIRVANEAGLDAGTDHGSEVVEMLVTVAKQLSELPRDVGVRLKTDDLDSVVMAAGSMPTNPSAMRRYTQAFGIGSDEAMVDLCAIQGAASRLYLTERPTGGLMDGAWEIERWARETEGARLPGRSLAHRA